MSKIKKGCICGLTGRHNCSLINRRMREGFPLSKHKKKAIKLREELTLKKKLDKTK